MFSLPIVNYTRKSQLEVRTMQSRAADSNVTTTQLPQ